MKEDIRLLEAPELARIGTAAFKRGDSAEYRACLSELRRRVADKARRGAVNALEELRALASRVKPAPVSNRGRAAGSEPAPAWLQRVTRIAKRFRSTNDGERCVYIVLLEPLEDATEHGLYVGETFRTPNERFEQHKTGIRASRHVRKRGRRVLTDACAHLVDLSAIASRDIEKDLADELEAAGFEVQGGH